MSGEHVEPEPDVDLVERVLAAIESGSPREPAALASAIGADATEVCAVLAALAEYGRLVEAARHGRAPATPIEERDISAGTRIGDFVVHDVLGRGAMGVVYRATQCSLGNRVVALKVLPRWLLTSDPRFALRFRREASLASTIHHRHLAEVYGFDANATDLCFAMRLVEGSTLHAVLEHLASERDAVPAVSSQEHVRRCVRIARAIADALCAIHARGLVHRDVKPSNVMLEGTSATATDALAADPVLVDFGLLRPVGGNDVTGERTLLGTPAYASPELLLGRAWDARTDVFSLGVVLHDLLTSTLPDERGPATAGLVDVRTANPRVDPRLAAVLAMATEPRKELRYAHGGEFRDDLDRWLSHGEVRALPSRPLGKLRLWCRREPARALRFGTLLLLPIAGVLMLGAWFVASAWNLTSAAATGARHERQGDLLAAANAYQEVFAARGQARLLPWLLDECGRAEQYWTSGSTLRRAIEHLESGTTRLLHRDQLQQSQAEQQFAIAHHLLCHLLLDDPEPATSETILAFLTSEARVGEPEFRQRLAMDTWADYLIAQDTPQHVPVGWTDWLAHVLAPQHRAKMARETRQAATVALGAIRSVAVLEHLITLMADEDVEVARLAAVCSTHVYRWLQARDRKAFDSIPPRSLEAWVTTANATRIGASDNLSTIARHIALWEQPPWDTDVPPRRLNLAAPVRAAVQAQARQLEVEWETGGRTLAGMGADFRVFTGHEPSRYESAIWRRSPADAVESVIAVGDAASSSRALTHGTFALVVGAAGIPSPRVDGTIRTASLRAATVAAWETDQRPGFVRFARPGHSMLRLRSVVPPGASSLEVRIDHMIGERSTLRGGGRVVLHYSLTGLAWEHTELAPRGGGFPTLPVASEPRTILDVPLQHFVGRDEIELVLEYLFGNTTHRIMHVEFRWAV